MKRQTRFAAYMSTMLTLVVVVSPSTRADAPTCNQLEEVERLLASAGTDLRLTDIVAIAPDDIWAVGYQWDFQQRFTLTAHYDGVDWTVTPSPSPGDSPVSAGLNAVAAVATDDVWAAGDYKPNGGFATDTLVLHWDGVAWEKVPSPGVSDFGEQGFSFATVEVVGADDVWFTGTRAARELGAYTARWNGSGFTAHTTPSVVNRAHEMVGLSALGPADVWGVGGSATTRGAGFVMRWNGSQWNTVLAPDFSGPQRYYEDVAALAVDDVWVTGIEKYYDGSVQRERPYFIHWDGSSWTEFATPAFAVKLRPFAPDDIYGISGDTLVHWDGAAWSVAGTIESAGALDNLVSLDGVDVCSLWMVGQVESGTQLAGRIVRTTAALPGDVDGDGDVNIQDLAALLAAYGTCSGDPGYDPNADFDSSGCIELSDLATLLGNYGL